ncbi:hypothetical protein HYV43_03505 [Candidatus Micrarchaeota archaeon]|nr:hypothetical protein [Candidatus Micrarchaeota archaeon]
MPFILATCAADVQQAKRQAQKAQAAAYRHDVAWLTHSESAAVQAWVRAYAKNAHYPIFLAGQQTLPDLPPFNGPHAGYNAALALGALFEQPVLFLADADLTAEATTKLRELDAEAAQGACTGASDEPHSWQNHAEKTLQSVATGVVSPDFAARQLQAALEGNVPSDLVQPCHQALCISARAAEYACLPPIGPAPLDVYANTAFFFHVSLMQPKFAWVRHEPPSPADSARLEKAWIQSEQLETYMRVLDYVFEKTRMRTISDFLLDEAVTNAYYPARAAWTDEQYQAVLKLRHPSLNLAYARLTRAPTQPDKGQMKTAIRAFFAAQNAWKETIRTCGEKNLEEKLRLC